MGSHELDILTRLDAELPIVDPEVVRLTELLKELVDPTTLNQLEEGYRAGIARFGARCLTPGHGPVTEADIDFPVPGGARIDPGEHRSGRDPAAR